MLHDYHHYGIFGRYYGFPECCIRDFVAGKSHGYKLRKKRHHHGTGFIPCYKCQRTKTAEQLLQEIQSRRICSVPFPEQHDDEIGNDKIYQEMLASSAFTDIEKGFLIGFFQYVVIPSWEEEWLELQNSEPEHDDD